MAPIRRTCNFMNPRQNQGAGPSRYRTTSLESFATTRPDKPRSDYLCAQPPYQDHGLVFCEPDGRPIDSRTFTRRFDALLTHAGLPHVNFHSARHAYATMALELGESAKVVQSNLGHAKISTTLDTYNHVSLDLQKQAAARLNTALQG
jgi:integrase